MAVSVTRTSDTSIEYVVEVGDLCIGYLYDRTGTDRGWSWLAQPRGDLRTATKHGLPDQHTALRSLADYVNGKPVDGVEEVK